MRAESPKAGAGEMLRITKKTPQFKENLSLVVHPQKNLAPWSPKFRHPEEGLQKIELD